MVLRCFLDGDALCITKEDFTNIQESDVAFIGLTPEQIEIIKKMSVEKPTKVVYCASCKIGKAESKGEWVKARLTVTELAYYDVGEFPEGRFQTWVCHKCLPKPTKKIEISVGSNEHTIKKVIP